MTSLFLDSAQVCLATVSMVNDTQARKRHININFFVRLVPSFHRICPRDKPSLSLGQIRWKTGTNPGILLILHSGSPISPGLSPGQTRFVPGTIPGTKGGTESLCEKSLCAFFRYQDTVSDALRQQLGVSSASSLDDLSTYLATKLSWIVAAVCTLGGIGKTIRFARGACKNRCFY